MEKEGRILNQKCIIDAHCHIFPHKIAEKAVGAIGDFYDIPMSHKGESQCLLESGTAIGVSKYLVCSTATRGDQTVAINSFIAEECEKHPEFFGFGTLHVDTPEPEAEIERIVSLGLHGIKLHPDFQLFPIDDPRMIPLYKKAVELSLPVLFHTGDDRYDYSNPERLAKVCDQVPGFVAIAAHFGGYRVWDKVVPVLKDYPNVYFDTSSSLNLLPVERALEMMEQLGYERFFFGTDFPMWDHKEEFARFQKLCLPEKQLEAVLSGNFKKLFHLS